MAKETAHQLGTPLSSMMGWISLLKEKESLPIKEIEKDIKRLNLISERFSKVGSIPNLESQEINSVIEQTTSYLKKKEVLSIFYLKLNSHKRSYIAFQFSIN